MVNTRVNTLPGIYQGIYQVFTWVLPGLPVLPPNSVFTWVFSQINTQVYPECIYLKVFTFSHSQICKISRNFKKFGTKMGNNPVGKKVNTPKVNTEVNTFLLLALGFYLNPTATPPVIADTESCT